MRPTATFCVQPFRNERVLKKITQKRKLQITILQDKNIFKQDNFICSKGWMVGGGVGKEWEGGSGGERVEAMGEIRG